MDFSDRTNCILCGDSTRSWDKAVEATQVEVVEEISPCSVCSGLADKTCLSTLENLVASMTIDQRLTFERNYADTSTCENLNDIECLATLDDILANALDKDRLELLTTACAALGEFPEYLMEASAPMSYSYEFTAAKASIDELATINDAESFSGEISLEESKLASSYSYEAKDAELMMAEALTEMRMPDTTNTDSSHTLDRNKKSHSLKSSVNHEENE